MSIVLAVAVTALVTFALTVAASAYLRWRVRNRGNIVNGVVLPEIDDPRWESFGGCLHLGDVTVGNYPHTNQWYVAVKHFAIPGGRATSYCRAVIAAYQSRRALESITDT